MPGIILRWLAVGVALFWAASAHAAGSSAGSGHGRPRPTWASTPSAEQMAEEYPADALRKHIEGRVILECDLTPEGHVTGCEPSGETPEGHGFAAAARRLAPLFRMTPVPCAAETCGRVRIPVIFKDSSAFMSPTSTSSALPDWMRTGWTTAGWLGVFIAVFPSLFLALAYWLMAYRPQPDDIPAIRSTLGGPDRTIVSIDPRGVRRIPSAGGLCRGVLLRI